ncbi:MAG: hypothetical protein BGP24_20005 [Lysobacterales bacterium 69-70]|nr:hypothetical protein [Xanthomonadaceae bacterium]ODU35769.1 MAG: hypothetical protein ABS97_02795 [Xanthomonadaceae bacterium SCN 69-320]ODV17493.1 MAG: hypothetical protein ABT27_17280 [Xanthomonadaceae bacterium SCN 69-25]OJY97257.1 MAG: hypothetical protein BGP24_20005 [Xanthomonadales bacterium 69-70]
MSGPDLMPRQPVWADVQLEAREALTTIEALLTAGTEHAARAPSERVYVASQLLRASSDHARAIVLVLLTEPLDFGAVALTLHRSQLEQFCRGMFFGKAATDAEVDYYLQHDELPSRPGPDGRAKRVSLKEMAAGAEADLGLSPATAGTLGPLAQAIQTAWDPLCGMVHGGHALLASYRGQDEGIGATVPIPTLLQVLANAVSITAHALGGYLLIAVPDELERLFRPASELANAYSAARKQRRAALAL